MQIGIPRALGYYLYFPFWFGFFNDLDISVKVSGKTNKTLVGKGSALLVPETCLPVKIYIGHVIDLLDKGVDAIYCPSVQSISMKVYNCSKLRGLPDLVRNVVKRDFTLIEPTLDKSDKKHNFYQYLYDSVEHFGITDKKRIKKASKAGWDCQNKYNELLQRGVGYHQAIDFITGKRESVDVKPKDKPVTVALCSHGYNLLDDYFSMKVIDKLDTLGANSYIPDTLPRTEQIASIEKLGAILYWANEPEITGFAGHHLYSDKVDGVITMTAFGCGPDSLMIDRITRYAKRAGKPLLNLSIDEHTGEAGFITRLEAFVDMLTRQKRKNIINNLNKQTQINCENSNCSKNQTKLCIG